jgi:benzoyl-CoA reductase/2-hydroxyglutaryl-CoA dehydratase subunit BcrC/BadD/HgdB
MLASQEPSKKLFGRVLENIAVPYQELSETILNPDGKVVLFENGLVPQLFYAFGCTPICLETQPLIFARTKINKSYEFFAAAEESGMPQEVCSTDRFIVGAALKGEYPESAYIVTTSSPCDGTRIAYPIISNIFKKSACYLEAPTSSDKDAYRWFAKQIKSELIPFMERITGKKFDIDRFREVIEESNRAYEIMGEIYDSYRHAPCPHRGAMRQVPYSGYMTQAGNPKLTSMFRFILDDIERVFRDKDFPKFQEKHRVLWAHVDPAFESGLFGWMEKQFGANVVITTLVNSEITSIDTKDLDSMLEGFAAQGLELTMSLMRRSSQSLLDYCMSLYSRFNCDCVILTQHLGCNSICGLGGYLQDYCRKKDIPLLRLELDYNDNRVVPSEALREKITEFFTTVMA